MKPHWLQRAETIRWLWVLFALVLGATLLAGLWLPPHGHFGVDGHFGFKAWYGFATCIGMIVIAKLLGRLLKRGDGYYDGD